MDWLRLDNANDLNTMLISTSFEFVPGHLAMACPPVCVRKREFVALLGVCLLVACFHAATKLACF